MPDAPLQPGTLAQNCWPATPQALYDEMFAKGVAIIPALTGILIQDAAPDPADRDKGWIPTSGGVPLYPGYVFVWHAVLGHWVSRHPSPASGASRTIYVGTAASVATYDGGDAGAPGVASGPMWEVDALFDGRTPVGVGVIPTSSPAATIANPLDTTDSLGASGEYKVSLTPDEMQHMHGVGDNPINQPGGANDDPATQLARTWNSAPDDYQASTNDMSSASTGYINGAMITAGDFGTTKALTDPDFPVVDGHNNMSPWLGVFFIKRTLRQWYVAA